MLILLAYFAISVRKAVIISSFHVSLQKLFSNTLSQGVEYQNLYQVGMMSFVRPEVLAKKVFLLRST